MNHSRMIVLAIIAVSSLATWLLHGATLAQEKRPASAETAWEFKFVDSGDLARIASGDAFKQSAGYDLDVVEKGANKLGAENWELVAIGQSGNYIHQYVFKRPKTAK